MRALYLQSGNEYLRQRHGHYLSTVDC